MKKNTIQNDNSQITGLSAEEAAGRLSKYGLNRIEADKVSWFKKAARSVLAPIPLMFIFAAVLSYVDNKIFDFYFIVFLMLLNSFVSFWQEKKADNAIEKLNELLKISVNVLRGGQWQSIGSESLVPGDVAKIYIGDVVPADLRIVEGTNLSVNEASVTGESLPVDKENGVLVYSGSFVTTGQAVAIVEATGVNTYFGKIFSSLDEKPKRSILEKDILTISKSLSLLSFTAVAILTIIFLLNDLPIVETLTLDLSLIIAGIPIALPTVLTLIISLGVLSLSGRNVVVRRLASLEDLANVDLLFTDKTGTLTKNEIAIKRVVAYGVDEKKLMTYAYLASESNDHDLINHAIINKAESLGLEMAGYEVREFIPADSIRKRSSASVLFGQKEMYVTVGAPQVVRELCRQEGFPEDEFKKDVESAAQSGYRVLAVAVNPAAQAEEGMELAGLLLLSDELRDDANETVAFLKKNGVKVKMLTGDHRAIAYRIGDELGLDREDIYSEVLPADKYNLVIEGKEKHIVAVTGDGVNDMPAVKTADVGFAVSNAVGALKSTADIVLLSSGISVITTAIIEARKIFARINSYSVYRISESLRLIITIFILGLVYHSYPLTPIQLILLAVLNDVPIVSLAFNRVTYASKPAKIEVKKRFVTSFLYGGVGVLNSMLFLVLLLEVFHYDWRIISTAFFLKLTVGGHLLVFVAHTKERWFRFLPSQQVIWAVVLTQLLATFLAVSGTLMDGIPLTLAAFIWIWAIFWMQVSDYMKVLQRRWQTGELHLPIAAGTAD